MTRIHTKPMRSDYATFFLFDQAWYSTLGFTTKMSYRNDLHGVAIRASKKIKTSFRLHLTRLCVRSRHRELCLHVTLVMWWPIMKRRMACIISTMKQELFMHDIRRCCTL